MATPDLHRPDTPQHCHSVQSTMRPDRGYPGKLETLSEVALAPLGPYRAKCIRLFFYAFGLQGLLPSPMTAPQFPSGKQVA